MKTTTGHIHIGFAIAISIKYQYSEVFITTACLCSRVQFFLYEGTVGLLQKYLGRVSGITAHYISDITVLKNPLLERVLAGKLTLVNRGGISSNQLKED